MTPVHYPSMSNEHSPLLGNGDEVHQDVEQRPFGRRLLSFLKGEGQVGFLQSYRYILFGSWLNLLLLFIPLSGISHYLKFDAGLRFLFSFLAIIPLAKVCTLVSFQNFVTDFVISLLVNVPMKCLSISARPFQDS